MTLVRRDNSLDSILDELFFGYRTTFTPDYDVTERDGEYELSFDLPGVDEANINLEVKDRVLNLEVKKAEDKESDVKYLVRNRGKIEFKKGFQLPEDVDNNKVEAEFNNGVLKVRVGKRDEVKPKRITIKS